MTQNTNEISIKGYFTFNIFENEGFCISRFDYVEPPETGRKDFVAKGNNLPAVRNSVITLNGYWTTKGSDRTFQVNSFEIELPSNRRGVIDYLTHLKCGIGKSKAQLLYQRYGENVWSVIENEPERLAKEIPGISNKTVDKLIDRMQKTKIQSKILQLFNGTNITMRKTNLLVKQFGDETLHILETRPYDACRIPGFSFHTMDEFALSRGIDPTNIERRKAAIVAALDSAATEGDVCLPRDQVIQKMLRLLNASGKTPVTAEQCDAAIVVAIADKMVVNSKGFLYTRGRYKEERTIVREIYRLKDTAINDAQNVEQLIAAYEQEQNIHLADNQKDAIKMVFENPVSVLTGGPGTGKTTVIRAILYCHEAIYGDESYPLLLSPTGKAARRMAEATGHGASTIHSALGIYAEEEMKNEDESYTEKLNNNLIIVDECSMMDQFVATKLLVSIPNNAKVVFVGDPNQLPSVGCGNVLYEFIRSTVIPVTKLSVIFRQAQDNPIIENAARVMEGRTDLLYDGSRFAIMNMDSTLSTFKRAAKMYVSAVRKHGLENVVLLCPYRKTTGLNVNLFNINLQQALNPKKDDDYVLKGKSIFISDRKSVPIEFRAGDKVMMTVNKEIAKNGDIGYIRSIEREIDSDDPTRYIFVAKIEFNDDGYTTDFYKEDMLDLDLAYCTTVHKSQGSEYKSVILVMSEEHKRMLKRNLFYTAITRAKENVLIVESGNAVSEAIMDVQTKKRCTLLGDRLHYEEKQRLN